MTWEYIFCGLHTSDVSGYLSSVQKCHGAISHVNQYQTLSQLLIESLGTRLVMGEAYVQSD